MFNILNLINLEVPANILTAPKNAYVPINKNNYLNSNKIIFVNFIPG